MGGIDGLLEHGDMVKGSEEVRLAGFFHAHMRGIKSMLDDFNKSLGYLPSKAAATLLFRFCVASNALAVAAAEGGLLVLIVHLAFLKRAEMNLFFEKHQ